MVIDGAWEKKIFSLWREGKFDKAKKEVFKFRLKYYDKLERVEDKIFIEYRMAFHEYKDGNVEVANIYFKNLEDIFSDEYIKTSCEYDYYRYKWLYINNNKNTLSKEYKVKEMVDIYKYYKSINDEGTAIVALETIAEIEGDESKILENLKSLLISGNIKEWNFVKSILKDCDKISHTLYIKALDIVNKYKVNIDVI